MRWRQLINDNRGKINVNLAMSFMGDHYDTWRKEERQDGLTLCRHIDKDELGIDDMVWGPFTPAGAVQAKATDSKLASGMQLWAIIGHPCGTPFDAENFLSEHPEFSYQKEFLRNMPAGMDSFSENDTLPP
jgi:hypothetical protein